MHSEHNGCLCKDKGVGRKWGNKGREGGELDEYVIRKKESKGRNKGETPSAVFVRAKQEIC